MTAEQTYNEKKYGIVPFHIPDYPLPTPSSHNMDREHERRIFKKVDEGIGQVPQEKLNDFIDLVDHLTKHLSHDTEKVRALFTWLGRQNVQNMKFPSNIDPNTPLGYLERLKDDTSLYAFFFTLLCREADVPCVILQGHSKAGDYQVGDQKSMFTRWNAVYVGEGWRFVHCNWAFVSLVEQKTSGYLKVEEDGQQMRIENKKKNKEEPKHQLLVDDNYFFISPDVLSYLCLPDDVKWQLMKPSVSKERFFASPFITPEFFRCGFSFKRGQSGTLNARNGESSVEIFSSASWKGTLKYMLFYKKNITHRFPNCDKTDRYVAMLNRNDQNEIKFIVRFPKEGDYILKLYLSKSQMFKRLCDFKFICDERQQTRKPFPHTPVIGLGPGRESTQADLYDFSHMSGLIELKGQQKQKLEISFRFKGDQRFTVSLRHVDRPQDAIQAFLTKTEVKDLVRVRVDPDVGEFALVINSSVHGNVLNYIIQCGQTKGKKEINPVNALPSEAMKQLSKSRTSINKAGLKTAVPQYGREDGQHLTEEEEYIKAKNGLRDAIRSLQVNELDRAIQEASRPQLRHRLQMEIEEAKRLVRSLEYTPRSVFSSRMSSLFPPSRRSSFLPSRAPSSFFSIKSEIPTGDTSLTRKDISALRTLLKRNLKPVKEVMTATFLLLGDNRWALQGDYYLRSLLEHTGTDDLLFRLRYFNPAHVKPRVVADARELLEQQVEGKLVNISPSVWKLYKEAEVLVEKCSKSVSTGSHSTRSPVSVDSGMDAGSLT